jgi:hypothetical protein
VRAGVVIIVLIAVAVATAVALRYGARRIDGVVATLVERHGSALTGTDVEVDGVDVALTAGRAALAGITIDNPQGYETDYAVRIDRADVALDVSSLPGDVPVIEELTLDGALIHAEQRDAATNLTDIQRHATAAPAEPSPPAGEPGRIVIERFRLTNARVQLVSEHLSEPEELVLRDVVVEGIGSGSGGVTYSEAAEAMLAPVLAAARNAASERLRTAAADAAAAAAREEVQEEADEAREEINERLEELLDRG